MPAYSFDPSAVAATLLRRHHRQAGSAQPEHALSSEKDDGLTLRVASEPPGQPLFELKLDYRADTCTLLSPFGNADLGGGQLAFTQPDPLWSCAHSICSHMEDDHANSFPTFLQTINRQPEGEVGMPWVESAGFFLADRLGYHFIPFPQPCSDANSVRATLIKMLRAAREQSS